MKKNLILVVAFMVMMMSNSCEDIEFINEHSLVGSWKITSFVMNGNDVTEQFSDFIITCDEDGSMIISGNGTIYYCCLLYTSDAADERSSVDLGGRRIIKKKN